MGFGRGINAEARRGEVFVSGTGDLPWRLRGLSLPAGVSMVHLVVPADSVAPRRDLSQLYTTLDRNIHATLLVVPLSSGSSPRAVRSVIGDARDLLEYVLRRRLGSQILPDGGIGLGTRARPLRLMSSNEATNTYDPSVESRLFIHIGATAKAREILSALRAGSPSWDGDFDHLDGDGYVTLLVHHATEPEKHLILAGASEYGSYFAVADFLQQDAIGARWLFPSPDGEVIPAAGDVFLPTINRFEEPDVRSRTMASLATIGYHDYWEIDAARAWQLRNRMRPCYERSLLFQKVWVDDPECGVRRRERVELRAELGDAFTFAMLESEERIASDHVMNKFLSAHERPFFGTAQRGVASVETYPERRPREPGSLTTSAVYDGMLDRRLGATSDAFTFSERLDDCSEHLCCPIFASLDGGPPVHMAVAGGDPERAPKVAQFERISNHAVPGGRTNKRFIPKSHQHHLLGRLHSFDGWHPCVFDVVGLAVGEAQSARASLVVDVATQLLFAVRGRTLRGHEFAHPVSLVDGEDWCGCDACTRADATGGNGDHLLLYLGRVIALPGGLLEREVPPLQALAGMTGGGERLLTETTLLTSLAVYGRSQWGPTVPGFSWDGSPDNPFRDLTLDTLAQRGVLSAKGYPRKRTRRLLALLNAVCARFEEVRRGTLPAELSLPDGAPVFAVHAYNEFVAPPPRHHDPATERCHAFLMPYLTGVRDTIEYGSSSVDPYARANPGDNVGAFDRLQAAPDQFNTERWSSISQQIGFYEYISSANGHVAPHLYSERLRRAVLRGVQHHKLRGFVSETEPHWGFDAPMLWETSNFLWNPGVRTVTALRDDFCQKAFGRVAAPSMAAFFSMCEEAWSATRDSWRLFTGPSSEISYPDRRLRTGAASGYFGDGYAGRGGYLSTLDGFYGSPSTGSERTRLLRAWKLLGNAFNATMERSAERERVQIFRKTFGLTLLIGTWYEPFFTAFDTLRRNLNFTQMQRVGTFGGERTGETTGTGLVFPVVGDEANTRGGDTPVKARTVYLPSVPSAGRVALGAALTAVRRRLDPFGDQILNGLQQFRNEVHRYLACNVNLAGISMDSFPTFFANGELRDTDGSLRGLQDVGLGIYSITTLPENAPFPAPRAQSQIMPVNAAAFSTYATWWNGATTYMPPHGTPGMATTDMRSQSLRAVDADPGLGWFFRAIKEMAGCLLGYSNDLDTRTSGRVNALCVAG